MHFILTEDKPEGEFMNFTDAMLEDYFSRMVGEMDFILNRDLEMYDMVEKNNPLILIPLVKKLSDYFKHKELKITNSLDFITDKSLTKELENTIIFLKRLSPIYTVIFIDNLGNKAYDSPTCVVHSEMFKSELKPHVQKLKHLVR